MKNLVKTLKELNPISDKVLLKYPKTVIVSEANDMMALIDCEKLECQEFEDTGIYELSKFNALLDMFDDFDILRKDNTLEINSRLNSAIFTLADIALLVPFDKNPAIFDNIKNQTLVSEFKLEKEQVQKIKKASSIFGNLEALTFKSIDGNVDVFLNQKNRFQSSNNTFKISFPMVSEKNFEISIGTENFVKLPMKDYAVKIYYNQDKDAYRIIFITDNFECVIANLN